MCDLYLQDNKYEEKVKEDKFTANDTIIRYLLFILSKTLNV